MMVYSLLALTLMVAAYSIYSLWKASTGLFRHNWHRILAAVTLGLVVYLYGTWVFLSVYLKYMFGACILAALLLGLLKKPSENRDRWPSLRKTVNILTTLFFGALAVLYFTGTTGRAEVVELSFPLKTGKYFILQGGKGLPSNFFHYSYRGAVFAIDIVKLNETGNRASHIFSDKLEDYAIFNDTVYSPCDGIVMRTENDNPDNIPPSRKRGPTNTNLVTIETSSYYVFMAHFKQGSVLVKEGQRIKQGQPIALVGNSGFTLEPHLHIQAHKKTQNGLPWYREDPLLIAFDGKSYLLFQTIIPKKVEMIRP
jgi:hypothetical protein